MTRSAVDNTIARLKAWVRENQNGPGWGELIDDLEDLRQHDEAQAAEVERLKAALIAAAEHHEGEGSGFKEAAEVLGFKEAAEALKRCRTIGWPGETGSKNLEGQERAIRFSEYHVERARVLRAAAEGKP